MSKQKKKNSNNKFNTKLNPLEFESFNKHAGLFSSLLNDKIDYDTQGFYKDIYNTYKGDFNAITTALTPGSETEHIGFDKYKKPNHPTFSKESKYYIPLLRNAGTWEDNYFNAANRNIRNMNKGYGSPMNYMQWAEDYDANGIPDVGLKQRGKILIQPEQKAMGGMIKRKDGSYSQRGLWDNIRANKGSGKKPTKEMLAQEKKIKKKMAVGGVINPNPIDPPNYKDRLQQYLSLSPEYRNMFTARSPLEYGLSTNGLDAGMYFNPMTNMPGMYGALNLNKKGFNLGAEKRIGLGENTTDINAGYGNDKFNVSGNLKRGTQGNEFGFSAGYNTPNLNIDASYSNAGGMPNVNANVGFNKNNFRGGLGYEYSGGNRLTGNVGYSKDAYDFGVSGMYSPTDSNINANLNYKLGTRKKQKTEPIPLAFNTPEEIQMIKESVNIDSKEAAGPPKKANGGKITNNMKKKKTKTLPLDNNLPKAFLGAILGGLPTGAAGGLSGASGAGGGVGSLSNMNNMSLSTAGGPLGGVMKMLNGPLSPLMGMTMNAVTNMTDAIVNPERERRPVLQNAASYTFDNGGIVGGPKKKYVKVKGKRLATDSPEYKEYYDQMMADRAQGIYYNAEAPEVTIGAKKMTKKEKKKAQEERYKMLEAGFQAGTFDGLDNQGNYIPFEGGKPGIDGALNMAVLDFINMGREDYVDGPLENVAEYIPLLGSALSVDDYTLAKRDLKGENKEGTFNNAIDMAGILPIGKYGNLFKIPKYIEMAADAAGLYGTAKDLYQDNISPMLLPNETARIPKDYDMNQKLFDYQKNQSKTPQIPMVGLEDEYAYGGMIDPSMYMQQMMYGSYAQGGQVPQNIPVEVEGQEMYEMPNGQMGEFQGPSHENGGIPVALPEGTKVYSDRLKVNGKTMADRKDKRERNIAKLEKLLTKNPNDKFVKEALKRQQETASLEEQSDMAMQEQANQQQAQQEQAMMQEQMMAGLMQDPAMMQQMGMMMYGGKLNKYAYGGEPCEPGFVKDASGNCVPAPREVSGVDINKAFRKGGTGQIEPPGVNPYDVMSDIMGNTFGNISRSKDPYINTKGGLIPNPLYNEVISDKLMPNEDPKKPKKPNKFMNWLNNALDDTGDFFTGMFSGNGKPKKEKSAKTAINPEDTYNLTEGDRTGMFGTSVGMYGPAAMTMLNRMETPKNINFFSTFGQDALRTQEEAEGLAGISKDEAYRKNLMRANALRKQLANSARGVGDIRSGQLSAELAEQEGARGILTNYLQGMSGLKGQRAQLQQQIDQTRMGGEYQRDLADRQDIDQYYTNLAENVANASNMIQKQGRDLNVVQYNKDIMALSKAYSKYGVYAVRDPRTGLLNLAQKDANGNVVYLSEDEVKQLPKGTQTTTVKEDK
jgi:hypothetical protein